MSNVRKKCKKVKEGAYNKETRSPGVNYELNNSLVRSEVSELLMWTLDMLDMF